MVSGAARAGFTLVELLIATAVSAVALGLAAALLLPAAAAFDALPESIDNQQRLRIAVQAIAAEIAGAGAGPSLGWGAAASPTWPAILPCRWSGGALASVPGGCARADAITLMTVGLAAPQGQTLEAVDTPGSPIRLAALSACTLASSSCRLHAGEHALLVDGTGSWDLLRITSVSADGTRIDHAEDALSRSYPAGALLAEAGVTAFSLGPDPATGVMQVRRMSGASAEFPVVDQVTALSFEYFGEAAAPALIEDASSGRRSATYGPVPPPPGVDNPLDTWPAGENCVLALAGSRPVSRLAGLNADETGLAPLPLAALADGPWCPDAASPNRFDADLLRIRLVRVAVRVQAQSAVARGGAGAEGASREATRWAPDLEVRFDVVPRNLRR